MSGPINRDSIAKCAPGNDFYAMIRNPTLKMPSQPAKQVDTIKSLQGQMEREALAHLGKTMQNFIFVARAGKFLFLAVAMPPYILLYGLPKFLLVDALPTIFQNISHSFKLANEKIRKLFKSNEHEKGAIGVLKEALAAVSTKAAEYIKWIDRSSKALFAHLKHQVVSLGYRLLQPYLPTLQKSAKAAETVTKMLLQKTYEKGDKNLEIAKEFAAFAWKVAKQECANQFRPFIEMVKNKLSSARKRITKMIERPRLEIQKFKSAITRSLKKTNEILKSTGLKISKHVVTMAAITVSYTARPLIEWATPKIQWTTSLLHSGREKMAYNFEKIRGFVQNLASGTWDGIRMSRQAALAVVKTVFESITPAFVKHFFNPEGGFKKKSQEQIQNLGRKFKKLKNAIMDFTADRLQSAKQHFFEFLQKILMFFKYLGQQITQLPQRMFSLAVKSFQYSIYVFLQIVHFMRWMSVWSRVLARLAWIELRETTTIIAEASKFRKN